MGRPITHGMYGTRTNRSWEAMKRRCLNPKANNYSDYGGRGISIPDKWLKFEGFYEDMGERPEGMSLERINNSVGYSKDNCRWATQKEQNNNKRPERLATNNTSGYKGVSYDKRSGSWVSYSNVGGKKINLYRGPSLEEAALAHKEWEQAA